MAGCRGRLESCKQMDTLKVALDRTDLEMREIESFRAMGDGHEWIPGGRDLAWIDVLNSMMLTYQCYGPAEDVFGGSYLD